MNSRVPKEILGLGLALSIILITLYQGKFKPFRNHWILIFLGFCFISVLMAPDFRQIAMALVTGKSVSLYPLHGVSRMWMFTNIFYIYIYSLFIMAIASYDFTRSRIKFIFSIMAVCGFLMSLYIFIQYFGLDQLFGKISVELNPDVNNLKRPLLGGFLGQSTIVASFIAMTIPCATYLRKYIWVFAMCLAIALTMSKGAILAVLVYFMIYLLSNENIKFKVYGGLIILILVFSTLTYAEKNELIYPINKDRIYSVVTNQGNGRINAWKNAWESFTSSIEGQKRTLYGIGPNSYLYYFTVYKDSRFWQLHNDPFEILINFGIIGFGLLFMAFKKMVVESCEYGHKYTVCALSSLFILFFTSLFTLSTQIAPNYFYACILIGLLHNKTFQEIEYGT